MKIATAAYPLDDLPEGCDALRLRTNQEMYWDRLRVVIGEPAPEGAREVSLAPVASDFAKRVVPAINAEDNSVSPAAAAALGTGGLNICTCVLPSASVPDAATCCQI